MKITILEPLANVGHLVRTDEVTYCTKTISNNWRTQMRDSNPVILCKDCEFIYDLLHPERE